MPQRAATRSREMVLIMTSEIVSKKEEGASTNKEAFGGRMVTCWSGDRAAQKHTIRSAQRENDNTDVEEMRKKSGNVLAAVPPKTLSLFPS